jgi:hypothetical protein
LLLEIVLRGVYRGGPGERLDSPCVIDPSRPKEESVRASVSKQEVLRDFEKLIAEGKLHGAARDPSIIDGAEFDPKVVKKKGKGTRFLIRKVPSTAKLLKLWARLFGNRISPCALFEALSARQHEFDHRDNVLLFGRGWIMYDTEIFEEEEGVGELTLSFSSVRDPALGALAFLKGARLRVVRVEHIRLAAHRSGYASTLFRHYEQLFRELGFDQFRLSAALSVGKYYWAKEGFDFSDESEIDRRKENLRALVKERDLPVAEAEIESLRHAYDFASFKRDVRTAAYRDAEGYYWLDRRDPSCEEVFLPLGKAFLLASPPWEGYKAIPKN